MTKILVVDDDEGVRLTLTHVLQTGGYAVWAAVDGREGVHLAGKLQPDIVLTDLLMPQQDGIETISQLRRQYPALRIVAMSGGRRMGRGDILQGAMTAGADEVLAKPFDLVELLGLVERLSGRRQGDSSPRDSG